MTQKFLHKRLVRRLISEAGRAEAGLRAVVLPPKTEGRKSDTRPSQRGAIGPTGGSGGGRATGATGKVRRKGCSGEAESGVRVPG